jgi:hypothetical protein
LLLVPTILESSSIHGLGVKAKSAIEAGNVVVSYNHLTDIKFVSGVVARECEAIRNFMWVYGAFQEGSIHVSIDDTRFINHSSQPNLAYSFVSDVDWMYRAARVIEAGEEITIDYNLIDDRKETDCYESYCERWASGPLLPYMEGAKHLFR